MHEMALCEGMLRVIEQQAVKDAFQKVLVVRVELGRYSGASEESLRFCFPLIARGTMAEKAALEFLYSEDRALRIVDLDVE